MKLKYYLRGLGIGVAVTALILGITLRGKPMGDEEIRARAAELGMVDGSALTLADLQQPPTESNLTGGPEGKESNPTGEPEGEEINPTGEPEGEESNPTGEPEGEEDNPTGEPEGEEINPTGEPEEENIPTQETSSESDEAAGVVITIRRGMDSGSVARMLAEEGLVADAVEFDLFLCNNGYGQYIHTGTYEIVPGTSEEEIAEIITGKQ